MELRNPNDGDGLPAPYAEELHRISFSGTISAEGGGGYFFSCPSSPVHYVLSSPPYSLGATTGASCEALHSSPASGVSFEFDGSAEADGSMISADELFLNGKIRPVKIASKMQSSRALSPVMDLDDEYQEDGEGPDAEAPLEEGDGGVFRGRDLRTNSRSVHRRARSMSPLRSPRFRLQEESDQADRGIPPSTEENVNADNEPKPPPELESLGSPASSSRSSSTGRNSKRWDFLKDLLRRSKSEGSGRGATAKDKFWHSISFSPSSSSSKSKPPLPPSSSSPAPSTSPAPERPAAGEPKAKHKKPANGVAGGWRQRRGVAPPSPHERLYTANRAQSEEMRRRTFLPYRQGLLLGCLGFNSRGYGAFHGFTKVLSTVSSR